MNILRFFSANPVFFAPLPTSEHMSRWDSKAQELGLPGTVLMENAARSAFQLLLKEFPDLGRRHCALLVGSGHNGGDAVAIGRYLLEAGIPVTAYLIKDASSYRGACAEQLTLAQKLGLELCDVKELLLGHRHCDLLLDGLLGTGFTQPLRQDLCELIQKLNALSFTHVVAIDIPSGLSADTGQPEPVALAASLTICMSATKKGLVLPCAKPLTGKVVAVPIGLPGCVRDTLPADTYLMAHKFGRLSSSMPSNSYKNTYGHVGIIGGGDISHTGAAHLAARAALRAGAGLVSTIAKASTGERITRDLAEIMLCSLKELADTWPKDIPQVLLELFPRLSSLVIGPGMGLGEDARDFLALILSRRPRPPMVVDADALMLLAQNPNLLCDLQDCDILTPHPGEAAALIGWTSKQVQQDRYAALESLTNLCPAVIVLKGAATLIGQKGVATLVSPWDIPSLAIGGAGDVLAGLLGALVAQKQDMTCTLTKAFADSPQGEYVRSLYTSLSTDELCTQPHTPSEHFCDIPDQAVTLLLAALGVSRHAQAALALVSRYPGRGALAHELADTLATLPC